MINLTDIRETTERTIEVNRIEAAEKEAHISNEICIFIGNVEANLLPEYSSLVDETITNAARKGEYKTSIRSLRGVRWTTFEKYLTTSGILSDRKFIDFFEEKIEELEDLLFQKYRDEGFVVEKFPNSDPMERRYKINWGLKEEPEEEVKEEPHCENFEVPESQN